MNTVEWMLVLKKQDWPGVSNICISPAFARETATAIATLESERAADKARVIELERVVRRYAGVHGVLTEDDRAELRAALGEQPGEVGK